MTAAPAAKLAGEASADSVTNVQTAGVDEGGIVKVHGEHLVILRRGRLFTVSIRDAAARRRSRTVDAFGAGIDPRGAWYDEMLISRQHGRRDRLQLRARRHRGGPVRHRPRGRARLPLDLPPALERLLLVAQLREPPDRRQAVFYTPLYSTSRRPVRVVPRVAQVAAGRHGRRVPAHRARDAHLPQRRGRSSRRGPRAAHGHQCDLARREIECSHARARAGRARVLRLAGSVYVWTTRHRASAPRGLGGVPHPARRQRATALKVSRQPDRPVLVPGKRRRPSQRPGARERPRRGDVVPETRAPATWRCCACRSTFRRPRARAAASVPRPPPAG